MTVLTTHYMPDITPSEFHPKRKDLSKEALETLITAEVQYNKMLGYPTKRISLTPVLPNLITSTDEVTIFASQSHIQSKDSFYLLSKPMSNKNKISNSGSRNNYKKKLTGDAHCRGTRIVINSTFTAGGLLSPIFVVVYGCSEEEMPNDDILTIKVPGLTVGSDQDVYSNGMGFLTFVKGKHSKDLNDDNNNVDAEEEVNMESKEARIAALYRSLVYYPFISHIRKSCYGWEPTDDDDKVPDALPAVSWMDGANRQLKEITKEERLAEEEKLKITITKHSATRTVVEQAADAGPMFKGMKCNVKQMDSPNASINRVYRFIEDEINNMHDDGVLCLPLHKKRLF